MAHTWKKDEVITSELMNDLENRADKTGEPGKNGQDGRNGKDGASITSIELEKNESGTIVGGTATMSDGKTLAIKVK